MEIPAIQTRDLTRHFVADHPGQKIFWIGPERDSSIHRGLDATMVPLEQADYIIWADIKTKKGQPKPETRVHIENDERIDTSLHLPQ